MNNIFDWATKELTLDAVISCILNEKDDMSIQFLEDILKNHAITDNDYQYSVSKICGVYSQGKDKSSDNNSTCKASNKIDVLAEFLDDLNLKHFVIIEDKANTYLHDNQMNKYIDTVRKYSDSACIHYVLLKTGSYYFWEQDDYRKQIQKYINNTASDNLFFNEYLSLDLFKFINTNIKKFKFSWIKDYRDYLEKKIKTIIDDTFWAADPANRFNDTSEFANEIINYEILKGVNYEYELSTKSNGGGKRNPEFKLYGICGNKAERKETGGREEEEFYLLPIISFDKNNKVTCFLNINKYSTETNPEGYIPGPSGQCKELRNRAIVLANRYGYKCPRKSSALRVCSSNNISLYNKEGNLDFSELKTEYNRLLKLAITIKNEFNKNANNR